MKHTPKILFSFIGLLLFPTLAWSGPDDFHPGPVFANFGNIADVEVTMPVPEGTVFRVSFDLASRADDGEMNRNLLSAARFINMHVAHGVPLSDLNLALVIHGSAVKDVTVDEHYTPLYDHPNANAELIAALTSHGVRIIVCGQSAAYNEVSNDDLLPGVEMALSAMTAHALLQQDGYSINPF